MNLQLGLDVWHFLGAALVGLWVGGVLVLTQLPDSPLSRPLRGFAICAALWALGDVGAALATDLFWKQAGVAVFYTGVIFGPPLWWQLAVGWAASRGVRLPFDPVRWTRGPLLLAGAMWLVMLTNPWHGTFIEPVVGGRNVYGPLWFAMAAPSYAMILGVFVLQLWILVRVEVPEAHRQAGFMIVSSGITLGCNAAYVAGFTDLNLTLPTIAASGLILTLGIVREGLFGVLPVALPVITSRDPDGIVVVRPGGGVLYANQRAREILSTDDVAWDAPLLMGFAARLRDPDGVPLTLSHDEWNETLWETLLQPGGALYRYGGDEDARWLRLSAQRVDRGGQLLAHSLRIHDATAEQQAETEVRRARRLDSLVALSRGVAHDFRNLLTVVRGNAQLLEADIPETPAAQRKLHRVLRAGEQAIELADQLRLYAGAAEPRRATVDLSELVRDTVDVVLDAAFLSEPDAVQPEIQLDLAPGSVRIEADATHLRQVVLNLIVNARDALGGEAGRIRVQTGVVELGSKRAGQRIVGAESARGVYGMVLVSDTGCGMDASTQERIFEPFFSTKGKHRGIGLSTVFGIVRAHDGMLELESRFGQGTTFRVYFPIAEDGAQA